MIEFLGAERRNGEAERDAATALAKTRLNDPSTDLLEGLKNIENVDDARARHGMDDGARRNTPRRRDGES